LGTIRIGPAPRSGTAPAGNLSAAPARENVYDGYRLYIKAAAYLDTDRTITPVAARIAEEIAYRTALTFVGQAAAIAGEDFITGTDQAFARGDQLWVRGVPASGAIIPGFPLTAGDTPETLEKTGSRAGIRLMSRVNTTTVEFKRSTWQWVTWDINTTTYVTIYLGRDILSSGQEAYQYGPRTTSITQANWALLRQYYALFPGDGRWLHSFYPYCTGGAINMGRLTFNPSFIGRGNAAFNYTVTDGMY
jgi:hypothetical protein